jgi:hypothetical protein
VVAAFVSGQPPRLAVGDERPLERDLSVIGSAILALGLVVAGTAKPVLAIAVDAGHAGGQADHPAAAAWARRCSRGSFGVR